MNFLAVTISIEDADRFFPVDIDTMLPIEPSPKAPAFISEVAADHGYTVDPAAWVIESEPAVTSGGESLAATAKSPHLIIEFHS